MSLLPLLSILKTPLNDFVIVSDNARSHASQISVVPCKSRQLAQERRDERRWSSMPADSPKPRSALTNLAEVDKVGTNNSNLDAIESTSSQHSRPVRPNLTSPLIKPVRQVSIKHLQTEKLPCLPKSGHRRTVEKSGSNRRLRLTRQGSREFVCKQGDDVGSESKTISLKVSSDDLKAILASGTGNCGPLRIPVRQRSIKGIECAVPGKDIDKLSGNKEMQQLVKENKTRSSHSLEGADLFHQQKLSNSPKFKRKTITSTMHTLFETPSREASIVPSSKLSVSALVCV